MKLHTKKRSNVSISADLLYQAKARNLNLSKLLEEKLKERLTELEAESWKAANLPAIQIWNQHIEKEGLWSDDQRLF